ncbi:MAG TPA: CbtA family protein [Aestuariivirgaceae bacterium]|nr:CbtA family protein [Aestuariivirgaceae bacterium]
MFRRIIFAAVLAGIAAGIIMSAVQHFRVTPYILAAETFEHTPHEHGATNVQSMPAAEPWKPDAGLERIAYTVLANLVISIAFALGLLGASLLLDLPITPANGAFWGLCGFLVFSLAPSAGLPPELPGFPVAELWTRQLWWWFTVAMTAGGLAIVAKHRAPGYLAVAILLIGIPHLIGAPNPLNYETSLPAHLASGFVANALASAAVFWLVLGVALGFINERTFRREVLQ